MQVSGWAGAEQGNESSRWLGQMCLAAEQVGGGLSREAILGGDNSGKTLSQVGEVCVGCWVEEERQAKHLGRRIRCSQMVGEGGVLGGQGACTILHTIPTSPVPSTFSHPPRSTPAPQVFRHIAKATIEERML